MSMKSGQDSQSKTENTASSQEPLSEESTKKSSRSTENLLYSPLVLKNGGVDDIKSLLVEKLVNDAEHDGGILTTEQKANLVRFMDVSSRGYTGSLGMMCAGQKCPFISHCPLKQSNIPLPIGKLCPVESSIITIWINKHLKALGIENPEDPVHSFDMDLLYELAGQELIRWRCGIHLSDDPRLVSNQQVGATQQGEPIFADVINPVLDVLERSGRNIFKIREALVATREAQVRAGQMATDPTQRSAELREKALNMAKKRRQEEKVKDADYKIQ